MKNHIITIPKEFMYLSEVTYYYLDGNRIDKPIELFKGIFNKVWTNTGGTTLALKDNRPTIILSPRKGMIENKFLQQDRLIKDGLLSNKMLLVKGEDMILNNGDVYKKQLIPDIKKYIKSVDVPKILCTYDSFRTKVLKAIGNDIVNYHIVVDECLLLYMDSSFKSEVEQTFINSIKDLDNVTFLSATPVIDESPLHKELDYYKCEFKADIFKRIPILRIPNKQPLKAMAKILKDYYIDGDGLKITDGNKVYISNEAVIFINSVKDIVKLVNMLQLNADECNIICAENKDNENLSKIKKLGDGFTIGRVPTNKALNKKFTFCTSTVFCGVDFYSDNAATFIVSDGNKENTTLDISLELPQIVGRQRNLDNVFRNVPVLIYNELSPLSEEKINDFSKTIEEKRNITNKVLESYKTITDKDIIAYNAKNKIALQNTIGNTLDYIIYDIFNNEFIYNEMGEISELMKLEIMKENANSVTIVDKINRNDTTETGLEYKVHIPKDYFTGNIKFDTNNFEDKLKEYCNRSNFSLGDNNTTFDYYILILGKDRIKALSYKEANLKSEIELLVTISNKKNQIIYDLKRLLVKGEYYKVKDIKVLLQKLYDKYGIDKKAKATDIYKEYNIYYKEEKHRINGEQFKCYYIL